MIALDYREPRPCCVRLSLLHVLLLLLPSLLHPPVHRSGVNLCPNLIIHICQPASCNVSHSLSLSPSLERLVATREEGRGEKNKHPAPRKWGYITININGSPVSSNFQPPPPLLPPRESGAISSASKCFDRVYRTVFHEISRILPRRRKRRRRNRIFAHLVRKIPPRYETLFN